MLLSARGAGDLDIARGARGATGEAPGRALSALEFQAHLAGVENPVGLLDAHTAPPPPRAPAIGPQRLAKQEEGIQGLLHLDGNVGHIAMRIGAEGKGAILVSICPPAAGRGVEIGE